VHETPLIERGSVLLSRLAEHYALSQQCFHKAVILIVSHSEEETVGLILNRPTAEKRMVGGAMWNVWYGGPCRGYEDPADERAFTCIHTREDLADVIDSFDGSSRRPPSEMGTGRRGSAGAADAAASSRTGVAAAAEGGGDGLSSLTPSSGLEQTRIIRGVYSIDLETAADCVTKGLAVPEDFLLFCGYCGWGSEQLQFELDADDIWVMAAADVEALALGGRWSPKRRIGALRRGLRLGGGSCSGSGFALWRRLCRRVGGYEVVGDEKHVDEVVRYWCARVLGMRPASSAAPMASVEHSPTGKLEAAFKRVAAGFTALPTRTVLVASATDWLLGVPVGEEPIDDVPPQYLHKAVLALLRPVKNSLSPAVAVLLNGPSLRRRGRNWADVAYGGHDYCNRIIQAFGHNFLGKVVFPHGVLQRLLHLGAISVAPEGVMASRILRRPRDERWEAAGGVLDESEAEVAALGDAQLALWFRTYLTDVLDDEDMDELGWTESHPDMLAIPGDADDDGDSDGGSTESDE